MNSRNQTEPGTPPSSQSVFITNDDGYRAPGIHALIKYFSPHCRVIALAPASNRSACSSSLSTLTPLRVERHDSHLFSCNGTTADCVHLAIGGYFATTNPSADQFDCVISGINCGGNLGDDVIYSGTVAGALEGRFTAKPSLAISLVGEKLQHYDSAARVAYDLYARLESLAPAQDGRPVILNVNVPDLPYDHLQGIKMTRLGTRNLPKRPVVSKDPRNNEVVWIGAGGQPRDASCDTDFDAVKNNFVSITPLITDYTDFKNLASLHDVFSGPLPPACNR